MLGLSLRNLIFSENKIQTEQETRQSCLFTIVLVVMSLTMHTQLAITRASILLTFYFHLVMYGRYSEHRESDHKISE